jgi:hypothetical protein
MQHPNQNRPAGRASIFDQGIRETGLIGAKVDTATGAEFTITLQAPVGMSVDLERLYVTNSWDKAVANTIGIGVDATPITTWTSLKVNSSRNLIRGTSPGASGMMFSPYRERHYFRSNPVYLPANQKIELKGVVTATGFEGQACAVVPVIADEDADQLARPSDLVAEIRSQQLVNLPLASTYAALDGSQENATTASGGIVDVGGMTITANLAPTSNYQGVDGVDALQVGDIVVPSGRVYFYSSAASPVAPGAVWGPRRVGFRGIDFGLFKLTNDQSIGLKAATAYTTDASGTVTFPLFTAFDGKSIGRAC